MPPLNTVSKPLFRARTSNALIFAFIMVELAALFFEEELKWCGCGKLYPLTLDVWGSHNSQHLFDPYSLAHFLHGLIFATIFLRFAGISRFSTLLLASVAAEGVWEVVENSDLIIERYRAVTASQGYVGDSFGNSVGDLISCGIGAVFRFYFRPVLSLLVFVLIELFMLVWIRDNLTLAVVMLVSPIESIKTWQLAGAPKRIQARIRHEQGGFGGRRAVRMPPWPETPFKG